MAPVSAIEAAATLVWPVLFAPFGCRTVAVFVERIRGREIEASQPVYFQQLDLDLLTFLDDIRNLLHPALPETG